jgi:hypothetical protein
VVPVREAGHEDAVGSVARELRGDVGTEHDRDVLAAQLAGELAAFRQQLERRPCRPPVGELDERPAVVLLRRRLLPDALGLVPARRLRSALARQGADLFDRGWKFREAGTGALGRDVAHGEHACRRSGLSEALVVLVHFVDEVGRSPHVDPAVCLGFYIARVGERDDRLRGQLPGLVAVIRLARRAEHALVHLGLDDACQMRPTEERRGLGRNLPGLRVGRLAAADHEVDVPLLLNRQGQCPRRAERVRHREDAVREVDAAVRTEREAGAERSLRLRRAHRHRDHLRIRVRSGVRDGGRVERVQQHRDALAAQLLRLLVELDRVRPRDLFDETDDLHVWQPRRMDRFFASIRTKKLCWTVARAGLVRPLCGAVKSAP